MLNTETLVFLGKIFLGIILSVIIIIFVGTMLFLINVVKNRFFLPSFTIAIFSSFRYPIKRLLMMMGITSQTIDQLNLDMRNAIQKKYFSEVPPQERIIFLPQCLRDLKCPARTTADDGILCVRCGRCIIDSIKKEAERLKYKGVYIVPGSTFIKRIIKREKPRAVLGVACVSDATSGMEMLEKYGLSAQAIYLLRDGCINTDVDIELLFDTMRLGVEENDDRSDSK